MTLEITIWTKGRISKVHTSHKEGFQLTNWLKSYQRKVGTKIYIVSIEDVEE